MFYKLSGTYGQNSSKRYGQIDNPTQACDLSDMGEYESMCIPVYERIFDSFSAGACLMSRRAYL